ncbi:hypothetical protein F511_40466 [Dorcoceras hygrometricum]|uniref:Uncharacterized protein n=1 Tax=Dorcoceras hygrometricum TaxID=472368 RepID=A0A2Z7D573_9LAMI|nr:hypothetical protein F511_40466 [Dorcoceras hygrometricum]
MSSSTESVVRSVSNSIDSIHGSPEVKEPWLPDRAELGSSRAPWYEKKSSNLRSSDISFIKEKGGMFDKFEVVLPGPEERAHRPPRGFHTFYINQLEMGLRFPLPRFIAALCQHIKISPSQLAPNSYSFLLALGVLLRYHNLPLVPYVLMQLVQVKILGPGKLYLSHKGDHAFIKGNPSSHKRWMRRFFFVKRVGKRRDPWKCEMSWRDNTYTLTPSTPERSPNLASFLDAMRDKSYNAPELIQEDLLCFFRFSRRGVELVGDLDDRMGKAEMLKALEEVEAASSGAAAPPKATKKRKASTPSRAPTPPIPTTKERPGPMPINTIPEASSPKKGPMKETGPGRVPPLNFFEDSLVVSPSGVVATNLLCHIAPDRDIGRLAGASNSEAVGLFSSNLIAALAWGGEVIKRLTRAQREAGDLRRSFNDTTEHCTKLETRLVDVEAARAEEARTAEVQLVALETRGLRLEAEKAVLLSEKKVLEAEKAALRAELDETKARAEEDSVCLRSEAINAWDLGKEFRANGYSEEEHPASFLDFKKALMGMADEEAAEEEEEEEEDDADATPSPPRSPKP